jgi:uncharacterized Zn-finger protein
MGNQSQDEVFLAAQEAVGAHRDSQEWRRNFRCVRCPKCYKNPETLRRHLNYECGIEPQFPCALCDKKFKRKYHLSRHMIIRHDTKFSKI